MFLSLNHFLNPKLVKGWDLDIWLQRELFILQGWEVVWGDGSQLASTELCWTDWDLRFASGAVNLWLPRAHPWKIWLSRFGLGFRDLGFKLPKAILKYGQVGGGTESQGDWCGSRGIVYMHITLWKVYIIHQEVSRLFTEVSRDSSKSIEQSQRAFSECYLI